ncbi:MAG: pilus (MSHA type) biogenesis protein MshL [Proteobacteria bacterium]|nr:MAG: pilus (MSHA type) biogenesis protein MshL [Pseudomonadota bacterium]QKK10503.1 MAG: pilus (MSHA type) biogenesis protein MshL [Pseudomonadota bacterium]
MKPFHRQVLIVALGVGSLLAGCTAPPPRGGSTLEEIQQTVDSAAQEQQVATPVAEIPRAVSDALLPPIAVGLPGAGPREVEQRFDVRVHQVDARAFFMGLVEGTRHNAVVHPDVSGTISLDLKNVTIDEVMDTVRDVYGYEYQKTRTGYQIMPIRMRSQIFEVNYINVKRSGKSSTQVSSGQVSDRVSSTEDSNGESSTTTEATAGSRIETQSDSDFWAELKNALQTLIGTEGGRNVVVTPQSGLVVVRALPAELREIAEFLSTSQVVLQRQVILEAKIVEVSLSDGFQSGINWAQLGTHNGESLVIGQTGGGTLFGDGVSSIAGNTGSLDPNAYSGVSGNDVSAFGGAFTIAANTSNFNAFIELLKAQGDVQVLSSPRVSTVNNQKAVIKVGSDEFFVTSISSTTTTGTTTTTTPEIELTPFFSGIALDVTPQIADGGEIILHIHPTVSEVVDQTKSITVFGTTQTLPLAFSSVRESDSIVRAASGQVVVIGGLMKDQTKFNKAGTPGLSDAPVVGGLFQHKKQSVAKTELVILLRPIVVDASGRQFSDDLRDTAKRIRRLGGDALE